jgi:hypothetical protein
MQKNISVISKEELYDIYFVKILTKTEICKKYKIGSRTLDKLFKEYNMRQRVPKVEKILKKIEPSQAYQFLEDFKQKLFDKMEGLKCQNLTCS